MHQQRLPRYFYAREPVDVARALIGKRVIRILNGQELIGRIVEAEAYRGSEDAASHARRGRTARNYPMFGEPGHSYVYFIYGMHWMFNVSAHPEGVAGAVLIRALEPEAGLEIMRHRRGHRPDLELTNGPAKLAEALAIDEALNDVDLCTSDLLTIVEGELSPDETVTAGSRLRVPGGEAAKRRAWRFWVEENPFVST